MDSTELAVLLEPFQKKCFEKGRPLTTISLEEAYPGDISTSYIVQVTAPWIDDMSAYEAIDFLFDILWETTDEPTRRKVFSIKVSGVKNRVNGETSLMKN